MLYRCVHSFATPAAAAAEPLHISELHVAKVTRLCRTVLFTSNSNFQCPGGQQTEFCSCECTQGNGPRQDSARQFGSLLSSLWCQKVHFAQVQLWVTLNTDLRIRSSITSA